MDFEPLLYGAVLGFCPENCWCPGAEPRDTNSVIGFELQLVDQPAVNVTGVTDWLPFTSFRPLVDAAHANDPVPRTFVEKVMVLFTRVVVTISASAAT